MQLNKFIFTFFLLFSTLFLSAQNTAPKYPKGYFLFPIQPGTTNYLSANMGELRSNHFHGGWDIKTNGVTGLPVYASAEGYISRLKVSTHGYGKTLYITHPNGLVTVYAHLENFNKTIQEYAINKQYELEQFDIDIKIEPNVLNVKKGEIIAKSGNTGSSGGPHLHWEIRTLNDILINPSVFEFNEIKDTRAPIYDKIAIRTFDINSRVNQTFGRSEFTPILVGKNSYTITEPITATGQIGIELKSHDVMDATHNKYGINCIELKVDGKEVFYHNLETFQFHENRYINVHIDYETLMQSNQRFEKCYVADGNQLTFYLMDPNKGKFFINDVNKHSIQMRIYDSYGNHSDLNFTIQGKNKTDGEFVNKLVAPQVKLFENILRIIAPKEGSNNQCTLYLKDKKTLNLTPSYVLQKSNVFLYDLRKGLIDSLESGVYKEVTGFTQMVPPIKTRIQIENLTLKFSDTTLFDTLYLKVKNHIPTENSETFEINNPYTPIYGPIGIIYCPTNKSLSSEGCYLYTVNNTNSAKYEGGDWSEDTITHRLKYLGKFGIVKDTVSPIITFKSNTINRINFSIFDKGSGIKSFNATLNGKWLLINYEHKTGLIWSQFKNSNELLKGEFVLELIDNAGNRTLYKKYFQ